MNHLIIVVSLFALFGYSYCALCKKCKNCDGTMMGKVASVDITGCTGDVCPLPKGSNVTITVNFQSLEKAADLTTVVHGIIGGLPVPFPLPSPPESCTGYGVTCPLASGKSYKYHAIIPVSSHYPSMRLVVKWELKDENSKDLFCIKIPVQIVSPSKKHENTVLKFQPRN